MPITGMNHAVLYVRDARLTQRFYEEVPGFSTITDHPKGEYVFMRTPASEHRGDAEHEAIVEPLDLAGDCSHFAAVGLQ